MNFNMAKNKIVMAIVIATGGLVVVGNGCSRFLAGETASNSEESYHGDTVTDPSANPGDIHVILGAPTASTIYSKQALSAMETQLGVTASTTTIGTYETKRGTMSQTGYVVTFTPPMAMAITAIVADVCNDVINQQASLQPDQRLFRDFNLTAAGRPSRAAMDYSIKAFALSSWIRQPDDIEKQMMIDFIEDAIAIDEVNGQRKAALMLCTAMNSTSDAIIR